MSLNVLSRDIRSARLLRFLMCLALVVPALPAQPATAAVLPGAVPVTRHDTSMWIAANPAVPGNVVSAMEYAPDGTLYLGGDFTYMGPPTGGHGIISNDGTGDGMADGTMEGAYPYVDGYVDATVAAGDGSGDFFIGGSFSSVGGVARSNLARINADGTLDSAWSCDTNGTVSALAVSAGFLYVGGDFTTIGVRSYQRLARVEVATGATSLFWAPNPNGRVRAIAVSGTNVYIGGSFTNVDSTERNYLACVSTLGGLSTFGRVTSWNPDANDAVYALAVDATYLFAGGDFTTIGATSLSRIAKFTLSTGAVVSTWNPVVNARVRTIAINTSSTEGPVNRLFLGGDFTTVDGLAREGAAAVYYTTGEIHTGWLPNPTGNVFSIVVGTDDFVYVGGAFSEISGQASQKRLARYTNDSSLMSDTMWNPVPLGGYVACIAVSGTNVSVGGSIYSVGAHRRNRIAALDSTGKLKSWYPTGGADAKVNAIRMSGTGKLYVGGAFTTIGTVNRNRLAELNPSTAAVESFNPNASAVVYAITTDGTNVYVGGDFATVGGQTRSRIAALTTAGVATAWYAGVGANATVRVLQLSATNDTIYVGGDFTGIFNIARNRLARLQTASPGVDAWDPNVTGTSVYDLLLTSSALYVGGEFTAVGATPRDNLAALSTSTGAATSWDPAPDSPVFALAKASGVDTIFAGGEFYNIAGQGRRFVAAITPSGTTAAAKSWDPRTNGPVRELAVNATGVVLGEGWSQLHVGTPDEMDWHPPTRFAFDDVAPAGTISINAGAASTDDPNVTVTINVTDDSPVVTQSFSFNNTSWLMPLDAPLTSTKSLALPAGDGTKVVYAKFKDESGNTRTVSDTIVLDTTGDVPLVVTPVAGADRYTTAIEASKKAYPTGLDPAGAKTVVIATGANWPDALGGASLAGALDGPILLTPTNSIPSTVMSEIDRLDAEKAVIVGGPPAVSVIVENALKAKLGSSNVERLSGDNRYATANAVAARVITLAGAGFGGDAFIATGANFPDSLAASPIAAAGMRPLYLVAPTATSAPALPGAVVRVAILGSTGAVNANVESSLKTKLGDANVVRLGGASRYDTAVLIATYGVDEAGLSWDGVAIATGTNFPDALGGGVLQGKTGSVMLLTDPKALSTPTRTALVAHAAGIYEVRYFGSVSAVSQAVRDAIEAILE